MMGLSMFFSSRKWMPISALHFLWLTDPHDLQGIPTPRLEKEANIHEKCFLHSEFHAEKPAAQSGKYLHQHSGNHMCYESKRERHERELKS
jgi:hypothetical protein